MVPLASEVAALLVACRADAAPGEADRAVRRLATSLEAVGQAPDLTALHAPIERIRRDHLSHVQRERELHRLLQTAQRLLGMAAVEELLGVIVEATRDLVGSQVAHINLRDRDGHFATIRATTGARTEDFRSQHTPSGAGLTGLVMRTRSPYVTEDYLTDPAIEHDVSGDASVRADHLVTMAGAPLLGDDEPVGVLMASWRRATPVTDEQLDLLTSLASLAAVAVATARRNEEARRSRLALEEANERFKQANAQLQWGAEAHDQLLALLLPGAQIGAVAATLRDLLDAPAAVLDPNGNLLAAAPEAWRPTIDRSELDHATSGGRATTVTGTDGARRWIAPAQSGGDPLAVLIVERDTLRDMEQRTLERAATAAALLLSTRLALAEAQFRSSADLVTDLIRGRQLTDAARQAATLGFDLTTAHVVLVTSALTERRHQTRSAFRTHIQRVGGLSGEVGGHLVAILPLADPYRAAADAAAAIAEAGPPLAVGASGPAMQPTDIARHHATALDCAVAQHKLTGLGPATVDTLGFVGLLLANPDRVALAAFVDRRLGPVLGHDAHRGTSLIETLATYLDHDRSVQDTAKDLHIHTNTVLQRLQRVETLLEVDLRATGTATELHLALQLRSLL